MFNTGRLISGKRGWDVDCPGLSDYRNSSSSLIIAISFTVKTGLTRTTTLIPLKT